MHLNFNIQCILRVGTFRRPPVHGLPKWTTLKILFRMSTVDPCVSSISNLSMIVVMADYFNNPNIKFTMELEENQEIPFIDVRIKRNLNNFTTTAHRKTTFTGLYTK